MIGATYLWFSVHPLAPREHNTLFGWKHYFEMLARNPNPFVRLPIDLTFAAGFLAAGVFLCRGIGSAFALDRWRPTFADPSKELHFKD